MFSFVEKVLIHLVSFQETQTAEVENAISRDSLEISNVQTRIERLGKIMDQLDEEIAQKNEIISRSEQEIVKRNAIIERKQNIIDQYNKRLETLISKAGVWMDFSFSFTIVVGFYGGKGGGVLKRN